MALKSIEEEWEDFTEMVFRGMKGPSEIQVLEMKKAFFAGAWAMFISTKEIGMPHISEKEAFDYLNAVEKECLAFRSEFLRKHAETN